MATIAMGVEHEHRCMPRHQLQHTVAENAQCRRGMLWKGLACKLGA